jgi:pimeloyl-ACP methyl ester carboxylesterase
MNNAQLKNRAMKRHSVAISLWVVTLLALATFTTAARGDDDQMPNIETPTLGGKMIWGDNYLFAGWRIQENILTDHHRLLDPDDVRYAWGTYRQCRAAMDEIRAERNIEPFDRHLVVLLHGLGRSRDFYGDMPDILRDAGYDAAGLNYPSLYEGVKDSARRLNLVFDRLEGVDSVSFIAHSLGSLVLRTTLAENSAWRERIAVKRVILLAPASNGSAIAELLKEFPPYEWIIGDAGQDLTPEMAKEIPGLSVPFGIIAGGLGDGEGYNPLIDGDDDGTLAVSETLLPGALDFILVEDMHSSLQDNPVAIDAMLSFLASGCFACP